MELKLYCDGKGNVYKEDKPDTYVACFSDVEYLLNLLLRCGAQWVAPCGTDTYIGTINGKEFYFNHDGRPLQAIIHDCRVSISPYSADVQVTLNEFLSLIDLA